MMKKLLGIVVLGLLWCNVGNAGINEPGQDQKCRKLIEKKKFFKEEVLKKVSFVKSQGHAIVVFYFSCNAKYNDWGYSHISGQILIQDDGKPLKNKNVHYSAYDNCMVNAKKSCKKLKLEDLGYSCSDLENQTVSRIDKIK